MQVAFVASHEAVRTVVADGFKALPPAVAAGGEVVLREGGPMLTGTLDGDAAILLEMPEELVSRFARSGGGDGDPRIFALPAEVADRFPVLAYRLEELAPAAQEPAAQGREPGATPPEPGRRRFPRGLVAGIAILVAACVGVALYLALDDGGGGEPAAGKQDRATRRQPAERPASREAKRSRTRPQPGRPAGRPRRPSRAIGSPAAGSLVNGVPLPAEGKHFFTWNIPRGVSPNPRSRRYATDVVVDRVLKVVGAYGRAHPDAPRVGIADLSLPRGGPFGPKFGGTGHLDHQNGTEVDVLYPRSDGKERAPDSLDDVDRRLAQDLLDRFLAAGAELAVLDLRLGLKAPATALEYRAHHEEHMHFRFPPTR